MQIIHTTLHKALKQAVRWLLVPRNVAEAVSPPTSSKMEILPLTEGQVNALLKASQGDSLEALYILAVTTGLRKGELLGLKWQDIDLDSATLRVRRTVFNGVVNPPKTARGNRSVKLTKKAINSLKVHPEKSEWVFSITNRSWNPMLKKAGLPRFHDLHNCATLLLTRGVYPKIVQEMLGHSSITKTLDLYSHVLQGTQEKAVPAMETILEA